MYFAKAKGIIENAWKEAVGDDAELPEQVVDTLRRLAGRPDETVKLPMVCCCGEYEAEADALRQKAATLLAGGSDELGSIDPDPAHFVSHIVVSLNWDFDACIEAINNDMWSGVNVVRTLDYNPETGEHNRLIRYYCECDRIEDGLAAIWLHLYEQEKAAKQEGA